MSDMGSQQQGSESQLKTQATAAGLQSAQVPSPQLLDAYAEISQDLPLLVMKQWSFRHERAFQYALVSLVIGGLLAISLILGFIYLVMHGHPAAAGTLLGAGALSMVAGFRSTRLD